MAKSELQDPFMEELAATFRSTTSRLKEKLADCTDNDNVAEIVREELRGLYHGILVIFDGGTALAEKGLIQISDDYGVAFDRYLHELCFDYWAEDE